jgi:acyl transferase domain-containing protein
VTHASGGTRIAVVGMACRFPGARTVEEFWSNLCAGAESITCGVPAVLFDDTGRRWVAARGTLDDPARFDAEFFGIPRREAELLDPQHRCLLECAWDAMEDAAYDPHRTGAEVAVYTTAGPNTYLQGRDVVARSAADRLLCQLSNIPDTLPTRISYKLDLTGESVNVQTACSSAMVAVHLACECLAHGRAGMALVGAANVRAWEHLAYEHQDGFILSADGHTRAYDRGATGYVEGDGAGAVLLKRLDDAQRDGDHVHAVILASSVNNDGSAKAGYSAPGVEGQARVIQEALARSGVDPATIGMVEGHGTATPVGDPIEVRALTRAYRAFTPRTGYCSLGSVKANIGHLGFASGMAGLIKAVLCVERGVLTPAPCFEEPNPDIEFDASPFLVNREARPWPEGPRRAGVSSFGMGGTNAHLVLEEPPRVPVEPAPPGGRAVLLSARTPEALEARRERLRAHLARCPDVDLADLAYSLAAGRRQLPHRWAAVVSSVPDLAQALDRPADGIHAFESRPDGAARPGRPEAETLAALAEAWAGGATVDWEQRYAGERRRRLPLPTYPWQGERFWLPVVVPEGPYGRRASREPDQQQPLERWLYRPVWDRTALPRPYHPGDLPAAGGCWLVLEDGRGDGARLLAELLGSRARVVAVQPGDRFEAGAGRARVRVDEPEDVVQLVAWAVAEVGAIERVVHLWPLGGPTDEARARRAGLLPALLLVQALAAAGQRPDLWVATERAQRVPGDAGPADVDAAPLLGLARVVPQEYPDMPCHCVDFAAGTPAADVVERLLAEVASPDEETEVAYRGRDRLVCRLEDLPAPMDAVLPLREHGVYLVTGGTGRMGLAIAEHLARQARVRLALVSRRGPDVELGPEDAAALQRLHGLAEEVAVLAGDVGDHRQIERVVAEIGRRWGAVNGVVHAAGIEESRNFMFLGETSAERAREVLWPKLPGIAVLDRAVRTQPVDFCIVCSSLNSVLGGVAYGAYAAANRYLDAYVRERSAAGARWVSANWDTWRFSEAGGAARIGAAASATAIRPEQGVALLGPMLASGEPQVVVSTVPLGERIARIRRSFRRQADAAGPVAGKEAGDLSRDGVSALVGGVVTELVGVPDLTAEDELLAVGCDSLTLLEAVARMERALGGKVPISELWGCQTLGELALVIWRVVSDQRSGVQDAGAEALRYLAG